MIVVQTVADVTAPKRATPGAASIDVPIPSVGNAIVVDIRIRLVRSAIPVQIPTRGLERKGRSKDDQETDDQARKAEGVD